MRRPTDRRRGRRGEDGFAAMALVLGLMLIMAALAAKFTFTNSEYQHSDQVNDAFNLRDLRRKMEAQIAVALMESNATNRTTLVESLCPDTSSSPDGTADGSCDKTTFGAVPWTAFGLPKRAVIDEFGAMVTYVMDSNALLDGKTTLKVAPTEGALKDDCSFVLIAHGPSGPNAKPASEAENRDDNGEFIARSSKDGFDDRVECGSALLKQVTGKSPDEPGDEPPPPPPEPIDHDIVLLDYHDIHDNQGTFTGKDTIAFEGGTLSGNGEEIVAHRSLLDGVYDIGGFGVASEGENCHGFLGTLNNNCYEINVGETLIVALDEGTASSFDVRFNMLSILETARVTGYLGGTKVGSLDYEGYGLAPIGAWITDQAFPDDAPFDELRFTVVRGDYRLAGVRVHP